MNETEQKIANKLLSSIENTVGQDNMNDVFDSIGAYSQFLNCVRDRLSIEAQEIENKKNA